MGDGCYVFTIPKGNVLIAAYGSNVGFEAPGNSVLPDTTTNNE
jgi:hypothetical protein